MQQHTTPQDYYCLVQVQCASNAGANVQVDTANCKWKVFWILVDINNNKSRICSAIKRILLIVPVLCINLGTKKVPVRYVLSECIHYLGSFLICRNNTVK
jgi:hypothetical protein